MHTVSLLETRGKTKTEAYETLLSPEGRKQVALSKYIVRQGLGVCRAVIYISGIAVEHSGNFRTDGWHADL